MCELRTCPFCLGTGGVEIEDYACVSSIVLTKEELTYPIDVIRGMLLEKAEDAVQAVMQGVEEAKEW